MLLSRRICLSLVLIGLLIICSFSLIGSLSAADVNDFDSNDLVYSSSLDSIGSDSISDDSAFGGADFVSASTLDDFAFGGADFKSASSLENGLINNAPNLENKSANKHSLSTADDSNLNADKITEENIYYVSKNGNDSNSGLNIENSYLTIDKALENIYLTNKTTTIYISEGNYTSEGSYDIIRYEDADNSPFISIIGAGANETILDGEGLHRIFSIDNNMSLLLKDLSIINGFYSLGGGGAIYNKGNLTLLNTYFYNNKACSGYVDGNTVSFGTVSGGAIYNGGNLIVENGSFMKNTAGDYLNRYAYGGAIYTDGFSKLSINNSEFYDNNISTNIPWERISYFDAWNAVEKGAAIASFSNDVSISNTKFSGNLLSVYDKKPDSVIGYKTFAAGGAVYFEGDGYNFINCSFNDNCADEGGAIYFEGNNIIFENCSFSNNSAFLGAAIITIDYNFNYNPYNLHNLTNNHYSNLSIINSNFNANHIINVRQLGYGISFSGGAGFLKIDNITIIDSNFTENGLDEEYLVNNEENYSVIGDNYCHSGAIFLYGQNSQVINSSFIDNIGEVGGAIMNYGYDTVISGSKFINNSAYLFDGGAIHHSIGDLIVENCEFDSNSAKRNGGTIQASYNYGNNYIFEQKSSYLNSTFKNSKSQYGGAIFDTGNDVNYENLEFVNNTASYGGAIYNHGFSNSFKNITFINNSAVSEEFSNGGAVYNYGSNVLFESCTFLNNLADMEGGAIFNFGESSTVLNNSFDSNEAFKGGSVYLSGNGGRFSQNLVNSSFAVYGGGLYNANTNLICTNNSFMDCKANVSGGAIYNLVSTLELFSNYMKDCKANLSGVGTGSCVYTCGNISYLVISFASEGGFNIVDNKGVLLIANITDNMGNPISGGNFSFILFNQSNNAFDLDSQNASSLLNDSNIESTVIGTSDVIEGLAFLRYDTYLELGSSYIISGTYSFAAEPIYSQLTSLRSVLSSKMYFSSSVVGDTINFGDDLSYELILLDSEDNYIPNAEILIYVDAVYAGSVFTNDVGYLNETIFNYSSSGKHYYTFIYEGDVFHNRVSTDLNFTVFYNNSYYYDDIVISFTDLIYSFVVTEKGSEIPFEFLISHNGTSPLSQVSTPRYFKVYENGEEVESFGFDDYLGSSQGQNWVYSIFPYNGKLTKVYRTSPEGIFTMPIKKYEPGLYEYTISFIGGLVKNFDPTTHNQNNEEDNYYNPCNISFLLLIGDENANASANLSYKGFDLVNEIDYPYYSFNLTDWDGNPLSDGEIRIYDNGSYIGSAFTDDDGFAEFTFPLMLDMGKHLISFVYLGEDGSCDYKIFELDVAENPYKDSVIISNRTLLNVSGPSNNFTAKINDLYNNNLSNFTIDISVKFNDGNNKSYEKNYAVISDDNGLFSIPLEFGAGNYGINCSYAGSKYYFPYEKVFNLNLNLVPTLLFGQSYMEVFKNDSYLTVILSTNDLKSLENQKIKYFTFEKSLNLTNLISNWLKSFDNGTHESSNDLNISSINLNDLMNFLANYSTVYYAFTNDSSISKLKINLPVGEYDLITLFEGNIWYNSSSMFTDLKIYGDSSKLLANENVIVKKSGYYVVNLVDSSNRPIIGEAINITVNGKSYTRLTDSNGQARLEINLNYGNYTIESKFRGNLNYSSSLVRSNLYVVDDDYKYPSFLKVNSSDIYRSIGHYDIILTDINGNQLSNRTVIVSVNGTNYEIKTDEEGFAHLDYDFNVGTYKIDSFFIGDKDYRSSNISSILTVVNENAANTILNTSIYWVLKGKGNNYTVTLTDKVQNPIAGQTVVFSILGKEYLKTTDKNGNAYLAINLNDGSYDIYSYFRGTDVYYSSEAYSKLVVLPLDEVNGSNSSSNASESISNGSSGSGNMSNNTSINSSDVSNGSAVNSSSDVSNVTGPNSTDNNGSALRNATQIVFKDMVTAAVASVDGRVGEYFCVTLKDSNGKILANKPIKIGFNGKVYNKTTDANGVAKLQINLPSVGTYTFAICFLGDDDYKGSFAVAKITVTPHKAKLTAADKRFKASSKVKLVSASFKTVKGNPISGKSIRFTINGKSYAAKTNSKGVASVKISLSKKGNYVAIAKFGGNSQFKSTSTKFYVKII